MTRADRIYGKGEKAYRNCKYKKALRLYNKAAKLGSADAMCDLGYIYYYGNCVPVDYRRHLSISAVRRIADIRTRLIK